VDSDWPDATQPLPPAADPWIVSPILERPDVAGIRHPIADMRRNVVGDELRFGRAVDLGPRAHNVRAYAIAITSRQPATTSARAQASSVAPVV
jgi:hypothetical protein